MFDNKDNLIIKQRFEDQFGTRIGIQEPLGGVFAESEGGIYLIPDTVSNDELLILLQSSLKTGVNLIEAAYGGNTYEYNPDFIY